MRVVFERNAFCLQELSLSLGSAKGEPLADVPIGKHDAMAWDDARSGVRVQRVSNLAGAARCAHERRHLAIRCHASARNLLDNLVYALEEALVPARAFFLVAGCASMAARFNRRWVRAFYTASDLPIVPRAHDIARSQLPRMGTDRLKGAAISSQLMKRARGMSIMGMSFGSQGEPLLGEVVYVGNTHSEHPRSGLCDFRLDRRHTRADHIAFAHHQQHLVFRRACGSGFGDRGARVLPAWQAGRKGPCHRRGRGKRCCDRRRFGEPEHVQLCNRQRGERTPGGCVLQGRNRLYGRFEQGGRGGRRRESCGRLEGRAGQRG